VCGPRPEPDAIYCSTCGRYLAASCAHCHAPITEIGARYCGSCGETLAA
jgi:predicted amidophosphoribosyltransferase